MFLDIVYTQEKPEQDRPISYLAPAGLIASISQISPSRRSLESSQSANYRFPFPPSLSP